MTSETPAALHRNNLVNVVCRLPDVCVLQVETEEVPADVVLYGDSCALSVACEFGNAITRFPAASVSFSLERRVAETELNRKKILTADAYGKHVKFRVATCSHLDRLSIVFEV